MSSDYARMARALDYIHTATRDQPTLDEIAAEVRLSPSHFQRSFKRWVGVSPKRYIQNLTLENAKTELRQGASVLRTSYGVGLSGPSRLHDLFVALESVTPGEYKSFGRSLDIQYGVHWTPFGPCAIAVTERGICSLQFLDGPSSSEAESYLAEEWPLAELSEDPKSTEEIAYRIFHSRQWSEDEPFHLFLRGTNFQIQVWRALLQIPAGRTVSYGSLGKEIGKSTSYARAIASAVAVNPIGFLIPCHRVIRESGSHGGYRWGVERKQQILAAERV
ncbi:MAG: methylated-DNA--[protein]-cysteine S-methyltransferase [Candidatus Bipolaricaulota bacterium]